jgi:hypothetical protein
MLEMEMTGGGRGNKARPVLYFKKTLPPIVLYRVGGGEGIGKNVWGNSL